MQTNNIQQCLITQTELCQMIGQSRSGLDKLKKKDLSFPKPIKFGTSRQANAYYVLTEVEQWLAQKILERDQQA